MLKSGQDITEDLIDSFQHKSITSLKIANVDILNKGPYILETLKLDKNNSKEEALNDIYKILRPGEAPSVEIAEEVFKNLYFNKERYDLSDVGRVKLNSKLNLKSTGTEG